MLPLTEKEEAYEGYKVIATSNKGAGKKALLKLTQADFLASVRPFERAMFEALLQIIPWVKFKNAIKALGCEESGVDESHFMEITPEFPNTLINKWAKANTNEILTYFTTKMSEENQWCTAVDYIVRNKEWDFPPALALLALTSETEHTESITSLLFRNAAREMGRSFYHLTNPEEENSND